MRVLLKTLGCRLNEAELESWAREFEARGCEVVGSGDPVDLLILNSCAVTQDATRKSRGLIRKLAREHPEAQIVLSGCYATLEREEAESLGVDLVVSNQDKPRLVDITLDQLLKEPLPAARTADKSSTLFRLGRHRAFIKVQDGCRYHCSYCIVTLARGEERSRKIPEILEEIRKLEAEGIGEVVLTGVHLGGYGSDQNSHLCELIEAVIENTSIPRIRLGSLEPWDLPDRFIDLFQNPRLMPHLHLPLQSGSDTILKRMARRTRRGDFLDLVGRLRSRIENINLTSDIIVGFPGETDLDWAQTLELVETARFGDVHIFSYSARSGTPAAKMLGAVPAHIKSIRSRELHQKVRAQKIEKMEKLVGETRQLLLEGPQNHGVSTRISGYTPEYHRVSLNLPTDLASSLSYTIQAARVTGFDHATGCLIGALEA